MKSQSFFVLLFLFIALLLAPIPTKAQEFIPLWNGNMPNSKGLQLKDSIANERAYQVATPGIYVFKPSIAENKHAAILIIPGGGYARLAYEISGFQLAKWYNTFGVTACVLFHRLPGLADLKEPYKAPLQDAQRALRLMRSKAAEWNIDTHKVGVMGSSAGGHLSASVSTIALDWSKGGDALDALDFRPNFTVLVSPVISMGEIAHKGSRSNLLGEKPSQQLLDLFSCDKQVTANTPPAILFHAQDDRNVTSLNSVLYYEALKKAGVAGSSLHIFPNGGHSIALRNNPGSTALFPLLTEMWMRELKFIE